MARTSSELLRSGYSDDEIDHLYELGRFFLENGEARKAEAVWNGLTSVAPAYAPAWLGMCVVQTQANAIEQAIHSARAALKADPESVEAMLFLASCFLTASDFNAAGTYLGEAGERIESGGVENPQLFRFYRAQLARYQSRQG